MNECMNQNCIDGCEVIRLLSAGTIKEVHLRHYCKTVNGTDQQLRISLLWLLSEHDPSTTQRQLLVNAYMKSAFADKELPVREVCGYGRKTLVNNLRMACRKVINDMQRRNRISVKNDRHYAECVTNFFVEHMPAQVVERIRPKELYYA